MERKKKKNLITENEQVEKQVECKLKTRLHRGHYKYIWIDIGKANKKIKSE